MTFTAYEGESHINLPHRGINKDRLKNVSQQIEKTEVQFLEKNGQTPSFIHAFFSALWFLNMDDHKNTVISASPPSKLFELTEKK